MRKLLGLVLLYSLVSLAGCGLGREGFEDYCGLSRNSAWYQAVVPVSDGSTYAVEAHLSALSPGTGTWVQRLDTTGVSLWRVLIPPVDEYRTSDFSLYGSSLAMTFDHSIVIVAPDGSSRTVAIAGGCAPQHVHADGVVLGQDATTNRPCIFSVEQPAGVTLLGDGSWGTWRLTERVPDGASDGGGWISIHDGSDVWRFDAAGQLAWHKLIPNGLVDQVSYAPGGWLVIAKGIDAPSFVARVALDGSRVKTLFTADARQNDEVAIELAYDTGTTIGAITVPLVGSETLTVLDEQGAQLAALPVSFGGIAPGTDGWLSLGGGSVLLAGGSGLTRVDGDAKAWTRAQRGIGYLYSDGSVLTAETVNPGCTDTEHLALYDPAGTRRWVSSNIPQ